MNIKDLISLTMDEAIAQLEAKNLRYRIAIAGGLSIMYTGEFVKERINLAIKQGKVFDAWYG